MRHQLIKKSFRNDKRSAGHYRRHRRDTAFFLNLRKALLHMMFQLFCAASGQLGVELCVGLACSFLLRKVCSTVVPILNFSGQAVFHCFCSFVQHGFFLLFYFCKVRRYQMLNRVSLCCGFHITVQPVLRLQPSTNHRSLYRRCSAVVKIWSISC